MRIDGAKAFGITLTLLAGGTAFASVWDWPMEVQSRHWKSPTLQWAQNTHPDHPSVSLDPVELRAAHARDVVPRLAAPTSADCTEFHNRLNTWLQDYLDISNVPQGAFDTFPKECTSICRP